MCRKNAKLIGAHLKSSAISLTFPAAKTKRSAQGRQKRKILKYVNQIESNSG